MKNYGKITVGFGTPEQRELKIIEFLKTTFKDNRVISVSLIEDESFACVVENVTSSGRNEQSTIWLSKESMIGLVSTVMIYFNMKGQDIEELLKQSVDGDNIQYTYSDNLIIETDEEIH